MNYQSNHVDGQHTASTAHQNQYGMVNNNFVKNHVSPPLCMTNSDFTYDHNGGSANNARQYPLQQQQLQQHQQSSLRVIDLFQSHRSAHQQPYEQPCVALPPIFEYGDLNCSPSIFRCTLTAIPQNQELLKKCRLPFGLVLHPFKDMKLLNVLQSSIIVRCRSCRTYINPFVSFPDQRSWKCNICHRRNDLPDEFHYDPASKSYGDARRRPEIKNATVEFIAPSEYMVRSPQPPVYLYVLDISKSAAATGYLDSFCNRLISNIDFIPGDKRAFIGFLCVDSNLHFFTLSENRQPKELIVTDVDELCIPLFDGLLINLHDNKKSIINFLQNLPQLYRSNKDQNFALGAALHAAKSLLSDNGGRVTVMISVLPTIGPGCLSGRENPNMRSAEEVQHLEAATDFYRTLALEFSSQQIAVDLFALNTQYIDLATIFVNCFCSWFQESFKVDLKLSRFQEKKQSRLLPKVDLKSGFSNPAIYELKRFEEELSRYFARKIGFEAVLRVRCTRAVDRTISGSNLSDAREAMVNACVDIYGSYMHSLSSTTLGGSFLSPGGLRTLPLYVLGLLKHTAFTYGTSIKLDSRVFALCNFRTLPLNLFMLQICPSLHPLHLVDNAGSDLPLLSLSYERIDRHGVYLMDTGDYLFIFVGQAVSEQFCQNVFNVQCFGALREDIENLPELDNPISTAVRKFITNRIKDRPVSPPVRIIREDSPDRDLFIKRLIEDRTDSAFSYIEFLRHIHNEIKP
uniref:Protein transport protein Sec24B n=1 Tax=Romanomermis culicivorax TaxID=13658 RepID=A0A915L664_ROMCU